MRLATIRTAEGTRAVRLDGDSAVELDAPDLGAVLARADWRGSTAAADGPRHEVASLDFAPLVVRPEKVVCVGLNYRNHIQEMGRDLPDYPTLFAKYSRSLVGARDDVVLPAQSDSVDWEAELGVVIGTEVRSADREQAAAAIGGYTIVNDVTARDWQNRTKQWLQGKTFEATTPVGPWLVTAGELGAEDGAPTLDIRCEVDGDVMQKSNTRDLVFDPAALVCYVSTILTLAPGDIIATGTPGGVGHARKPPRYLENGSVMVTAIDGIGECRNICRR